MDDSFAVIAKCVKCDFALYIKCAAVDMNVTCIRTVGMFL